jgi:hypothetical protein
VVDAVPVVLMTMATGRVRRTYSVVRVAPEMRRTQSREGEWDGRQRMENVKARGMGTGSNTVNGNIPYNTAEGR